eukprot:6207816-Pleurochrysis_carterae.AAC.3
MGQLAPFNLRCPTRLLRDNDQLDSFYTIAHLENASGNCERASAQARAHHGASAELHALSASAEARRVASGHGAAGIPRSLPPRRRQRYSPHVRRPWRRACDDATRHTL